MAATRDKNFSDHSKSASFQVTAQLLSLHLPQAAGAASSSWFSGVSNKSIVLRNSGLWGGDTSNVDLQALS